MRPFFGVFITAILGSDLLHADEVLRPDITKALAEVERLGGSYERAVVRVSLARAKTLTRSDMDRLTPLRDNMRSLSLRFSPISDEGLADIGYFSELTTLDLAATSITDAALEKIASLTKLRTLWLSDTEITGSTFYELRNLKDLEHLGLSGTKIDRHGLKLLKLLPWLKELSLQETEVDSACVAELRHLVNLKVLRLHDTTIRDDGGFGSGLPQALVQLDSLQLSRTMVDDRCIPHVAQFPALFSLSIEGTRVTPTGVSQLAEFKEQGHLKRLAYLYVSQNQLSEETRTRLKDAFPKLNLRVVEDPVQTE